MNDELYFSPHPPEFVHPYADTECVILKTLLFYICIKRMWKFLMKLGRQTAFEILYEK